MKNLNKKLALLLAVLMLLTALASCQNTTPGEETAGETAATTPPAETKPGNGDTAKTEYSITVKSAGGLKLSGVNIYIYTDETLEDLVNYTTTDESGIAKIALKPGDKYVAVLSGLPEGYLTEASYPLTGTNTELSITSAVIDNTDHSGLNY
jgi:hypothetical protein